MSISISSSTGGNSGASITRLQREQGTEKYFAKLNDKYKRLSLHQGKYRTFPEDAYASEPPVNVFMDSEVLFTASQDEKYGNLLHQKTGKFADLQKSLEEKFLSPDRKLLESGFVVDKKGDIYCRGKGEIDGKESDFNVKICNVKDKYVDMNQRFSLQFEVQSFHLLNIRV